MNEKAKGYLNIANKAGYIIFGGDSLKGYKKKLYLLLISDDAGTNLIKIVNILAKEKNIPAITVPNLSEYFGNSNIKALGIKNLNLASIIEKLFKEV